MVVCCCLVYAFVIIKVKLWVSIFDLGLYLLFIFGYWLITSCKWLVRWVVCFTVWFITCVWAVLITGGGDLVVTRILVVLRD